MLLCDFRITRKKPHLMRTLWGILLKTEQPGVCKLELFGASCRTLNSRECAKENSLARLADHSTAGSAQRHGRESSWLSAAP